MKTDERTMCLVLQRGFVIVGKARVDGDDWVFRRARVVIRWGTTRSIGELRRGPTPKTILGEAGTGSVHRLAVVMALEFPAWPDEHLLPEGE